MITTFIGPMFSNKSQKLIDIYNNIYNKKTIFTFKPNIDKRDMMYIKSRNNDFKIYSFIVDYFDEIEHIVHNSKDFCGNIILIDEAQFLKGSYTPLLNLSLIENYNIYISGLNLTTDLKPFGVMPEILSISDVIIKCHSTCYYCGKEADYTKCLIEKSKDILIGDKEYIPICKDCLRKEVISNGKNNN